MMILRQRQPREEDPAYLAYVRTLPCTICRRPGPSDPAHLRTGARQYDKPHTGMGEKPSDRWVLPLCRAHHEDQHRHNELEWWVRQGYADPFALAMALYAGRPVLTRPRQPSRVKRINPRKPPADRVKFPQRADRWPPGRKLTSRNTLRKSRDDSASQITRFRK